MLFIIRILALLRCTANGIAVQESNTGAYFLSESNLYVYSNLVPLHMSRLLKHAHLLSCSGSRDMVVENNIFIDVNATYNSGEGMTWNMKAQGQNSSSYYSKLVAAKANVPGSAFREHYPSFDIEAFVPPDCPQNQKCGPALFNQTYRNNIAVNTTSLVPFPSTSGMDAGHGVWRATSDAGEPVGPKVPWPPMSDWYTVTSNLVS